MAISSGKKITTEAMQSIARVEVFTDASVPQDQWNTVVHFETGQYENGKLIGSTQFGTMRVSRQFADIKNDPEILQLMALIKKKAYQWREEDIQTAEKAEAKRAAENKPE